MAMRYPVMARVRSDENDQPKPDKPTLTVGIFDHHGYWYTIGKGPLVLPGDNLDLGNKIASMINAAYDQGRDDAKEEIRAALGIGE